MEKEFDKDEARRLVLKKYPQLKEGTLEQIAKRVRISKKRIKRAKLRNEMLLELFKYIEEEASLEPIRFIWEHPIIKKLYQTERINRYYHSVLKLKKAKSKDLRNKSNLLS